MDIATVIGILAGFTLVISAMLMGGGAAMFLHLPSMLITVGGMLSATFVHFSIGQVFKIASIAKKALFCKLPAEADLIQKMVNFSAINRRDGALALEQQIPNAGDDFLVKGLQMVIDGQGDEAIEKQLTMEIQYLQERHQSGKKILEFMGASAPAFGMIGTLIGLVSMLRNLSDPTQIGGGMATSLLTTFYGALLANLVFVPMAGKLDLRSRREAGLREMVVEGLLGLVRGDSPTAVRDRMQAFISAKNREELKPSI